MIKLKSVYNAVRPQEQLAATRVPAGIEGVGSLQPFDKRTISYVHGILPLALSWL